MGSKLCTGQLHFKRRLAHEKAEAAFQHVRSDPAWAGSYILAADTVVAVGRRILPKAESEDQARSALELLSGRRHRVHCAVALVGADGRARYRLSTSAVAFKRLSEEELKRLDKVAYVRFASVYRHFRDIGEFMNELKDLLSTRE